MIVLLKASGIALVARSPGCHSMVGDRAGGVARPVCEDAMTKHILLAGETFVLTQRVTVGYDLSGSGGYANGATRFLAALPQGGFSVDQLPSERCETGFPASLEALDHYDAVVLSDIGALSLFYTAS